MVENKILLQSQPTYSSSINLGELFLYRLVFNRLKEMNKLEKWLWTNCELKDKLVILCTFITETQIFRPYGKAEYWRVTNN